MSIARIKKGDTVIVISGDSAGKTGKVLRVMPSEGMALVEGVNTVRKAQRRSEKNPAGGFVDKEMPVRLCKLMPYDAEAKKGVRVRRVREGDTWVRKSAATGKTLE